MLGHFFLSHTLTSHPWGFERGHIHGRVESVLSVYLGRVNIQIYSGRVPICLGLLHAFKLPAEANLDKDLGNGREGQEYWILDLEKTVLSQL